MRVLIPVSVFLASGLLFSISCTKSDPAPNPVPPGGAITAPPEHEHPPGGAPAGDPHANEPAGSGASGAKPIAPRVEGPVGDVLDSYESARAKLAADDLTGSQPFAKSLAAAARSAAEHAVTSKPSFDAIAAAADKMAATKDIKEARAAFGEVSQKVVSLLVADPELRTGRFLFMCPMAKGYQKWVQTNGKLNNPYFGSEMLECGEELKTWAI